jgi:hypothetical protein
MCFEVPEVKMLINLASPLERILPTLLNVEDLPEVLLPTERLSASLSRPAAPG